MTLRIVHLYPTELGLFGDVGNVTALTKRAQWSGVEVEVTPVGLEDSVPADADIYVIGSGSTAGLRAVGAQIGRLQRALSTAHAKGATVFAVGAGMHLMTRLVEMADGQRIDGVGLIDAVSSPRLSRMVGGVFTTAAGSDVAGFVNSGHEVKGDVMPLITGLSGIDIDNDGVRADGFLGTHLHGSFLSMNPRFADDIILRHTGTTVNLDDPRVARATYAAGKSRESLRREFGS